MIVGRLSFRGAFGVEIWTLWSFHTILAELG